MNAKRGTEGLSSFQSVLAHDLVYWDPESCPNETHFFKLGFTTCKVEQPLQGMELQENEAKKD